MRFPEWQYDEMIQVGADFKDPQRAASYDERIVKLGYIPEKIVNRTPTVISLCMTHNYHFH